MVREISPLRSIWFRPGKTIKSIAHDNPGHRLLAWPILAGCGTSPSLVISDASFFDFHFIVMITTLFPAHPIVELLTVFVGAYLIRLTGYLFGGRAGTAALRTAFVWSQVPMVVLAIMSIGVALTTSAFKQLAVADSNWKEDGFWQSTLITLFVVEAILVFWSLYILVAGIVSIQRISWSNAVVSCVLAWLVFVLAFAILVAMLGGLDAVVTVFSAIPKGMGR